MNFSKVVGRNLKILAVWLVLAVWLASTKRVDRAKVWGTNKTFWSQIRLTPDAIRTALFKKIVQSALQQLQLQLQQLQL